MLALPNTTKKLLPQNSNASVAISNVLSAFKGMIIAQAASLAYTYLILITA